MFEREIKKVGGIKIVIAIVTNYAFNYRGAGLGM